MSPRDVAQVVRHGVWVAGGDPVELPAMSLGDIMVEPAAMGYRSLLARQTVARRSVEQLSTLSAAT
jgi:hypothetical protein